MPDRHYVCVTDDCNDFVDRCRIPSLVRRHDEVALDVLLDTFERLTAVLAHMSMLVISRIRRISLA